MRIVAASFLLFTAAACSAGNKASSDNESGQAAQPVTEGKHCGGNIQNAPTCPPDYVCSPDPASSGAPVGDVGGTCTKM